MTPTQTRYPWRAVARTTVGVLLSALIVVPVILGIVSEGMGDYLPPAVIRWLAIASGFIVALSGTVTRIMAIPGVDSWLARVGLSAAPASAEPYDPAHD